MDDLIDMIDKRIADMENYRARLVRQAQTELDRLDGALAELQYLKSEMTKKPETEQAQEADSAA